MKLTQLLEPWIKKDIIDGTVSDIKNDSRLVKKGDLFVAYPGAVSDGRLYIEKAVASGAVAVVYEPDMLPRGIMLPTAIPCIAIPQLAEKLGEIAKRFLITPPNFLI